MITRYPCVWAFFINALESSEQILTSTCHILDLEPNSKTNYYGTVVAKESVVGLTTKQLVDKMNQLRLNSSISNIHKNYLGPLNKQGIVDYCVF